MLMLIFFSWSSRNGYSRYSDNIWFICVHPETCSQNTLKLYNFIHICIVFDFWLTSETEGNMIALVTGSTPANNVRFCSFFVFEFSNFQNYKFCIKHAAEYMQLNTLLLG